MTSHINSLTDEGAEPIGVRGIGVSREEAEKLRNICLLSMTRKRRYYWHEQHSKDPVDIVILGPLANGQDPEIHGIAKVTLGENKVPSVSAYHIQAPLMGIHILRILDQVEISKQLPEASVTIQTDKIVDCRLEQDTK